MNPSVKPKTLAKHLQYEGATLTQQILALKRYEHYYAHVLSREDSIWLRITIPNLIRIRKKQLSSLKK